MCPSNPVVSFSQEAYNDAKEELFGTGGDRRGKKRRKSAKVGSDGEDGDEEDAFFKSLAVQDKLPKFVELLKFRVSLLAR